MSFRIKGVPNSFLSQTFFVREKANIPEEIVRVVNKLVVKAGQIQNYHYLNALAPWENISPPGSDFVRLQYTLSSYWPGFPVI